MFLGAPASAHAQNVTLGSPITTVVGNGTQGYSGDGFAALGAEINQPFGLALDSAGNLYIADTGNNRIRKVDTTGTITTVAGNGTGGYSGDNGPATSAALNNPDGVAVDSAGNLYIADYLNNVIRKVDTGGTITTFAGNGTAGYSGDNGPAALAEINSPFSVAVDSAGNLYFSEPGNDRIRKVNTAGTITTVAGDGTATYTKDNIAATTTGLYQPTGVAVDSAGNLYIAEEYGNRIHKVNTAGIITTVAGNGTAGYSGDNGPANGAEINLPLGLAVDGAGDLYIADAFNSAIRRVDTNGVITTVAGNGTSGHSGDNGTATSAELGAPTGVAVDNSGRFYISENYNNDIREVTIGSLNFGQVNIGSSITRNVFLSINTTLTLSAVQASGDYSILSDSCALNTPISADTICTLQVQFAPTQPGNRWFPLVVTDSSANKYSFELVGVGLGPEVAFTPAVITTVAGNGTEGSIGDNGPATSAEIDSPFDSVVDSAGNLYIVDTGGNRIRKVDTTGTITTVAGNGTEGYGGDNGPATSAELNDPTGVALDSTGNLFIADELNNRIRKVDTTGKITTVAGNGTPGYTGDNAFAINAEINSPFSLAVDNAGNLYFSDVVNDVIRKVNTAGIITTVAGNGSQIYNGDGIAATAAGLNQTTGVAVDSAGNLYIAEEYGYRIRKVNTAGIITTVAGDGVQGYSGDNGPATSAKINSPFGVAVDSAGDLYIADAFNSVIRRVDTTGIISTVAGNGTYGYNGDNGPATSAELGFPAGVSVDGAGNFYIADYADNVIRKVQSSQPPALTFSSTLEFATSTDSPRSFSIQNVGNQPLTASLALSPNSFVQQAGPGIPVDCASSFVLAPGAGCNVSIDFIPQTTGGIAGAATFTDNSLNASTAPADMQSVTLSGTGVLPVFSIGGTVSGLSGTGLVLQDNGGNNLAIAANGSFTFTTLIASGGGYSVTVLTQPAGPAETCSATNASGTVSGANVTSIQVQCTVNMYQLTIAVSPAGSGTVTPASGSSYAAGTVVNLQATPNSGYAFLNWTGAVANGSSASTTVTMTAVQSVTANFKAVTSSLTVLSGQSYTFINGKINGSLTMTGGTVVLNNSVVSGNVTMSGGSLLLSNNSKVQGNMVITGGTFSIDPSVISGNLQIQNIPIGAAQNSICGTTISGNLQFVNNGTAVVMGSASVSCPADTIAGNVQIANNSASTQLYGDTVNGNVQVTNNTAATQIEHNKVAGNVQITGNSSSTAIFSNSSKGILQCSGNNSSLISGGGNTAALKQGQCASF